MTSPKSIPADDWIREQNQRRLTSPKNVRDGIISGTIDRLSCYEAETLLTLKTWVGAEIKCRIPPELRDQVGDLYAEYPPADVIVQGFIPAGSTIVRITKIDKVWH